MGFVLAFLLALTIGLLVLLIFASIAYAIHIITDKGDWF